MDLDVFRGVVAFVASAEAKSFRKAAASLGVSAAAISKAISALEEETGVKLFVRGAREVALTSEGESFLSHCRPAVRSVAAGRAALDARRKQPQGELVVSAPFVATSLVAPALKLLRERHPRLSFSLKVSDELASFAEQGIDVAVRIGALADSGLVAKKIRETRLVTVASPAYLSRAGSPESIDDLAKHACIGLVGPNGKPFAWWFREGPREIAATLLVDHGPSVADLALAGAGVTQLFDFMAAPLVREGRLLTVLDGHVARGPDVYALSSPGRQPARVRAAIDALVDARDTLER
jgi:DNA-binding transcriptional LysR family regulator